MVILAVGELGEVVSRGREELVFHQIGLNGDVVLSEVVKQTLTVVLDFVVVGQVELTKQSQEFGSLDVLGGCDLLEIVGAVVGWDAVDVVDLHTGCTLADPCFVDKDVAVLTTKVLHKHIQRVSTCFLGRSVRCITRFNLIDGAAGDGEESSVAGAVELRVSFSRFSVAAEAYWNFLVDELGNKS